MNIIQLSEEEVKILRSAIPILSRILNQATPTATATETPKKPTTVSKPKKKTPMQIGTCQYINRKLWNVIHSVEELDTHAQKCTSNACETINGIRLCAKHKKNDIDGLVKAIHGEEFIIPEHVQRTNATQDTTNTEELIKNMDKEITRIYQQSKYETYNCECHGEECFMLLFENVAYIMDVLGMCFGRISNQEVIHSAKMKHKRKQCFEVKEALEEISEQELAALKNSDLCLGKREL